MSEDFRRALEFIVGFVAFASLVVGLLPESARNTKFVGVLVQVLDFLSVLTMRTSPGTLKAPLTRSKPAEGGK
jgi:hypothetical protein